MTALFFLLSIFALAPQAAGARKSIKPLYTLPEPESAPTEEPDVSEFFLIGTSEGLFRAVGQNTAAPLWTGGKVEQILRVAEKSEDGKENERWYFRTSDGIISSRDLKSFEEKNDGLEFLTIKKFDGENVSLVRQSALLKDICADPRDPRNMVTATESDVYLTRDGGETWKSIGSMSKNTPGIKAVAVATMDDGSLVVFSSHTIFGFSYYIASAEKPAWRDVSRGIKIMESLSSTDEIADIYPMKKIGDDGSETVEIYFSQSYLPNVYKFDWAAKAALCIYSGGEPCDTLDALTSVGTTLLFSRNETLGSIDTLTLESPGVPENLELWKERFTSAPGFVNCAWVPRGKSGFNEGVLLGELWLLYPGTLNTKYGATADGKKCVYASAYQCRVQEGIDKFRAIIKDNRLNALVIDMKDDYGFLRYDTRDPLVSKKGRVTQYKIDLDHFISEFKKDDVYLVARIVVFKDRNLTKYDGGKYAVWDFTTKSQWTGVKSYKTTDEDGNDTGVSYYDESWVDPYSPEVWEYNVAIARELVSRGFDEIQFDYIRFPTDGLNLRNASFRWKSDGMTKESALISFLSYARENIDAPIGIDIYGANGWYRSGTRTGQDAEMLAEFVDVVSPMFYPSHFEASFMHCAPYADRPYRIYYYGTYRNTVMMRNRAISRPWAQAFKLGVRYDRQYYGPDYIQKEIFGARDAANHGYMYWNNVGDYSNLRPDIGDNDKFIGTAPEADEKFRKPAIGTAARPLYARPQSGMSALRKIAEQERAEDDSKVRAPFLSIPQPKPSFR